ncbi:MAG: PhnD/SsuA/transferrin family substrate-binding protein [Anaerolineae bacterium]|nr:PhnD/SsuA/transferrin family substrate-binding protein [Anaerolineae bacterium]
MKAITYLAPSLFPLYQFIVGTLSRALGQKIDLEVGASDYSDVEQADMCFICGLPYVRRASMLQAIAAPVLRGERYQNRPIYFSDVIVHRDSSLQQFADLRGRSWAYNEPESQSGYGITDYSLRQMGENWNFFGQVVEAGFHQKAVRMVCQHEVDAAAIDSQVLAIELRDHPKLAQQLRVIHVLGPSTIQPIAVSTGLPASLKDEIQAVITHLPPQAAPYLQFGLIARFVSVTDADYDDIRAMQI